MPLKSYFFLVIILGFSEIGDTVAAAIDSFSNCPGLSVYVDSNSSKNRALVCEGAEKARTFFLSHQIQIKRPIHIKLHAAGINNYPAHIGLYDSKKDQIDLLTLEHAKLLCASLRPFGMPMNESLYVSFVAHEVAHAIADQNLKTRPSSLVLHEYLAYVTQFSTMELQPQTEILKRYNLEAFQSLENMSLTYYRLDPSAFGVKVFLHFQSLPNQSQFIQGLLSGRIKPEIHALE
ncbi:MAG: hypothetical protein KAI17_03650 [Thiotrichaceae bacterium]|nr:hypothetical protein [Thiotrichaceae bacterium]